MKRLVLVVTLISVLIGLVGCADDSGYVSGIPVPVDGEPVAVAAEALLVPVRGDEGYALDYYLLETGRVGWRITLEGIDYQGDAKVAFDGAHVYVAVPGYVRAYRRQDGEMVWETLFEGAIDSNCARCFIPIDGRVLVQSDVGRIYALDAETGETSWRLSQPRDQYDALGLYTSPSGGENSIVAFIARVEGNDEVEGRLQLVDVKDGRKIWQIEASCTPEEFWGPQTPVPGTFLHFDRQGETIYLGFATFPDATCIQAWRVEDGALLWETQVFDDIFDNAIFRYSDDEPLLVHEDALYVGRDSSREGNGLTRIDLASGEVRALLEGVRGSRYVLPVVYREDTLVLFVQDDEFFKVWGVDATTGERLWSHRTEVTSDTDLILPYDLSYAKDLAVAITNAGVVVIEAREDESDDRDRLYVRLLDLQTGEPLHTVEREFGYLSLNGMPVVVGDSVYLVAYLGLYRFDTLTGDLKLVLGEELHGH